MQFSCNNLNINAFDGDTEDFKQIHNYICDLFKLNRINELN